MPLATLAQDALDGATWHPGALRRPSPSAFQAMPANAIGQVGPAPAAPTPSPVPDAKAAAEMKPDMQQPSEPPPAEVNEDILAGPEAVSSQASTQTIPGGPGRPSGLHGGPDHYGFVNNFFMGLSAILIGLGLGYDHCMDAWSKYSGAPKERAARRSSARSQGREISEGSGGDAASGS